VTDTSKEADPRIGSGFPKRVACKRTELDGQLSHVTAKDRVEEVRRVVIGDVCCGSFYITELDRTWLVGRDVEDQLKERELLWGEDLDDVLEELDEQIEAEH
jgi:hypothetical protein